MQSGEANIHDQDVRNRTPVDHDALLTSFLRHWNRLPRAVREDAAELIVESHLQEIEP